VHLIEKNGIHLTRTDARRDWQYPVPRVKEA
jgi:hypothetical protein